MSDSRTMMRVFEALPYTERGKVMAHVRAIEMRSWTHAAIDGLGVLWVIVF